MEKIKEQTKNYIVIGAIIILVIVASIMILNSLNNDGMNNSGIYNLKYRVYQNRKWSKYSKNGIVVGDKENPIQNIDFKIKENKGRVFYYTYTNDWSKQIFDTKEDNISNQIYGLRIDITDTLYKKYMICYRTYNKKDKWLNWACCGETSGNSEEPITAVEIKIIPRNGNPFDYLKDYNKKLKAEKNF